jgi:acetyl esterase/lipase
MPLFAALDDQTVTASSRSIFDPQIVNSPHYAEIWKLYLGPLAGTDRVPGYAAPARMDDLTRLPPAYIYVGELDPMRDENIEYAMRLMQAGVPVELHVFPGAYHGFARMAPCAAVSKRAMSECLDALQRGLAAQR